MPSFHTGPTALQKYVGSSFKYPCRKFTTPGTVLSPTPITPISFDRTTVTFTLATRVRNARAARKPASLHPESAPIQP